MAKVAAVRGKPCHGFLLSPSGYQSFAAVCAGRAPLAFGVSRWWKQNMTTGLRSSNGCPTIGNRQMYIIWPCTRRDPDIMMLEPLVSSTTTSQSPTAFVLHVSAKT